MIHSSVAQQSRSKNSTLTAGLSNVRKNSLRPLFWKGRLRILVPEMSEYEICSREYAEILRLTPNPYKRQQPQLPKGWVTSSQYQHIYRKINHYHPYHMVGQNKEIIRNILIWLISYSTTSSRFLSKDFRSQSSIKLGFLVRIIPKEEIVQRTISNRRFRIQEVEKLAHTKATEVFSN